MRAILFLVFGEFIINFSDGTPSAKCIKPEVRTVLDRAICAVEARAEAWGKVELRTLILC